MHHHTYLAQIRADQAERLERYVKKKTPNGRSSTSEDDAALIAEAIAAGRVVKCKPSKKRPDTRRRHATY